MDIINSEYYSFEQFKSEIEETYIIDGYEIDYQLSIIKPLLKKIFINTDIQVADTAQSRDSLKKKRQANNNEHRIGTAIHDIEPFTGYKGSPDLVIGRNLVYLNRKSACNCEYLVSVEIKQPNISWEKHIDQIKSHLSKIPYVIFTDCISWCFFTKSNIINGVLQKPKIICLKDANGNWLVGEKKTDEYLKNEFCIEFIEAPPEKWDELLSYIKKFCMRGKLESV